MKDIYICAMCNSEFEYDWSKAETVEQKNALFGDKWLFICNNCKQKIIKEKGLDKKFSNNILPLTSKIVRWFYTKIFPKYIRLWPTYFWLAMWSAPNYRKKETNWQALRITIRHGKYHSTLIKTIKKGII